MIKLMIKKELALAFISGEPVLYKDEYGNIQEYTYIKRFRIHKAGRWEKNKMLDYSVALYDEKSNSIVYVAAERVFRKADLQNNYKEQIYK